MELGLTLPTALSVKALTNGAVPAARAIFSTGAVRFVADVSNGIGAVSRAEGFAREEDRDGRAIETGTEAGTGAGPRSGIGT